jgi:spore coat protein A
MKTTRREFLELAAATGVATIFPWQRAHAETQSPELRKFIQMLPGLGPAGIPLASPTSYLGADYYQLVAGEYTQQLHPQLPHPTRLWGYADATTGMHRHLGPVIVAQRGTPVRLSVTNYLPPVHPLPIDASIPGAELPPNRMAVHLHGGHVPWISDGGPYSWFGADGTYGPSAVSVPDMGVPAPGTFN